jgi:hypothetical protein
MPSPALRAFGALPLLSLGLCACHDPAPTTVVAGKASVSAPLAATVASLSLQTGRGWQLPGPAIRVAADGSFVLPESVLLATVFADRNQNGQLDRFLEPSSPCQRLDDPGEPSDTDWSCELWPTRLLVQRLVREQGELRIDRTLAIAEVFDPTTLAPDPSASLCDARGVCAVSTQGPFADVAPGLLLGLCDLDSSTTDTVELRLTASATPSRTFRVPKPPLLSLQVGARPTSAGTLLVTALADRPIGRWLVWVGRTDEHELKTVLWSSEDDEAAPTLVMGAVLVTSIPAAIRSLCRAPFEPCTLAVQVAAEVQGQDLPMLTQAEVLFEVST